MRVLCKKHFLGFGAVILFTVGLIIQSGYTELISVKFPFMDTTWFFQSGRYLKQGEHQARDIKQTELVKSDGPTSSNRTTNKTAGIRELKTTQTQNDTKLSSLKPATKKLIFHKVPHTITTAKSQDAIPKKHNPRASNEITLARKVDSDKYVVYLCSKGILCGGLGDRLKGIHSTFLLALALKRKFRIISTVPCDLFNQLGENQEPWHEPITPGLKNKTITMIDGYTACGDKIFGKPNKTKEDFDEKFPEPVLVIRTNQGWTHRFHEEPYKTMLTNLGLDISHFVARKIIVQIYNHLFKLQPNLLSILEEFMIKAKHKPGIKLVCAQIRMGYNPSIPRETSKKTRNNEEWLPLLWDFLSLYNDSSKYTFFITTDSQQVREYSQKLFPNIIMDTKGNITHVDRFENKDKACIGMEKTILDFTILANCDITVVSRSNFGKLSSELQSPASKLYTFQEGIIHEGPEGYQKGKVFNRTTKSFTDDCSKVYCPPPRNTRCAD